MQDSDGNHLYLVDTCAHTNARSPLTVGINLRHMRHQPLESKVDFCGFAAVYQYLKLVKIR